MKRGRHATSFNKEATNGHKLTPEGLKADESKIEAIVKMSPPKNETDLKSFLAW